MKRTRIIFSAGLLVLTSTGAMASFDGQGYQAQYQILAPDSATSLGIYSISQVWQPESKNWLQRGTISFRIKTLLTNYHYDYSDEVIYSGNKMLSYRLKENDNGTVRQVTGESDNVLPQLNLTLHGKKGKTQQSISNTDFDYTLFALRFPLPCERHPLSGTKTSRIMTPLTGEIEPVQIRYLGYQSATLPGDTVPRSDRCLIEITSSNKSMLSQSWMNAEGYLVYAIYPRYRLLLLPQVSTLPHRSEEKSS